MALLTPSPISTSLFHYEDGLFTAEASDLPRDFRLGPIYDDACDVGFTLVSARTGKTRVFAFQRTIYDPREGEKLWDEFALVTDGSGRTDPSLRVQIYND